MSRTLSKVLIICALVVVLPLMIAGTAFAAYYSINATVSIEIAVDQLVDGGHAEVSYKDQVGRINKKLEVTDGHLKKVTFKTSAVGYDFVGWYAGTAKAYAEEVSAGKEIKYVVKTKDAKVEMTDYQNLVAVFKAKRFTVGYSYIHTPELDASGNVVKENGEIKGINVTEAPSSKNGLIVDGDAATIGKTEFVYGEQLHTLDFEGHPEITFDGWYVGEGTKKYTKANFTETGDITLTGKWVDSAHITLTYLDQDGTVLTQDKDGNALKTDLYASHKYTLADPMNFNHPEGFIENGYAYGWKDKNGNIIKEVNSETDVTVQLVKNPVIYTAKLEYDSEELQLASGISNSLTFSIANKDSLNVWNDAANWSATYKFWGFDHLEYNDAPVTNFTTIIDQVIAANPHDTTEITFNAVKKTEVSEIVFDKAHFASDNLEAIDGPVYKEDALLPGIENAEKITENANLSKTVFETLGMLKDGQIADFYNAPDKQGKVEFSGVRIAIGSFEKAIAINETTTLYQLIDLVYANFEGVADMVVDGTLTFEIFVEFV